MRNWSSSRSRFVASAQYKNAVAPRINANADIEYQNVKRPASDQAFGPALGRSAGKSGVISEYITHAPDGMDQFLFERFVHLCPEPANMNIYDIGAAVESHVPDLAGDEIAGQRLPFPPSQKRQEHEFLGSQLQVLASSACLVADQI